MPSSGRRSQAAPQQIGDPAASIADQHHGPDPRRSHPRTDASKIVASTASLRTGIIQHPRHRPSSDLCTPCAPASPSPRAHGRGSLGRGLGLPTAIDSYRESHESWRCSDAPSSGRVRRRLAMSYLGGPERQTAWMFRGRGVSGSARPPGAGDGRKGGRLFGNEKGINF